MFWKVSLEFRKRVPIRTKSETETVISIEAELSSSVVFED